MNEAEASATQKTITLTMGQEGIGTLLSSPPEPELFLACSGGPNPPIRPSQDALLESKQGKTLSARYFIQKLPLAVNEKLDPRGLWKERGLQLHCLINLRFGKSD